MEINLYCKILALGIIVLFIGMSVTPSTGKIDVTTSRTTIYDGGLSGYVNDTSMNPIGGVRVRVYFHGKYEEDYSDSTGYYHVTNIPICWCMKNCTASKDGYTTEWVWLAITKNTTYDFILISNHPPEPPEIGGPSNGIVGKPYEFDFSTVDPEGHNVSFYVEWGDGTIDGWSEYVESGGPIVFSHAWFRPDGYFIRCKAKDIYGAEGNWSILIICISRNKVVQNTLFLRFLEQFPILHRLVIFD